MLEHIERKSADIYDRLRAEGDLFEEILFNASLYVTNDFEYDSKEYLFLVKFDGDDISVDAIGLENYKIKLKYNDECVCFVEILYD